MPANIQPLTDVIVALAAQATKTVGTTNSAIVVINGFAAKLVEAVTAALTADDAADNGSIQAAVAAIEGVRVQFADSDTGLGAAIAANPGTPTNPPNPPTP